VDSIHGRISYVRHFNPGVAMRLQEYLEATLDQSLHKDQRRDRSIVLHVASVAEHYQQ